ncbi:MAG: hypothetical protein ACK493_11750 [Planctomycetota bacterium]|jgi:hypothetical protein|nr:hypothetical protein [Blastopirellula sp.]
MGIAILKASVAGTASGTLSSGWGCPKLPGLGNSLGKLLSARKIADGHDVQ